MQNQDTILLLRECNNGTKMGVTSIDDIQDKIKNESLRSILIECKDKHSKLGNDLHILLQKYGETPEDPSIIAKGMSWIKTNVMMAIEDDDSKAADMMTEGCNMGIKSLNKHLNDYKNADDEAKKICTRLIEIEEQCVADMKKYL